MPVALNDEQFRATQARGILYNVRTRIKDPGAYQATPLRDHLPVVADREQCHLKRRSVASWRVFVPLETARVDEQEERTYAPSFVSCPKKDESRTVSPADANGEIAAAISGLYPTPFGSLGSVGPKKPWRADVQARPFHAHLDPVLVPAAPGDVLGGRVPEQVITLLIIQDTAETEVEIVRARPPV